MSNGMVTTNISLPREDWRALKVLAASQETSMADLIRQSVKRTVKRLTVNGFTPEFEDEVLRAAAEPVDYSKVWETEEDIDAFFRAVDKKVAKTER